MNKEVWSILGAVMAVVVLAILITMTGCVAVTEDTVSLAPEPNMPPQWGNGDLPAEFRALFGDSNGARLDFVQNQAIDKHNRIIVEIARRVLMLEGTDPNEVAMLPMDCLPPIRLYMYSSATDTGYVSWDGGVSWETGKRGGQDDYRSLYN